MLNSISVIYLSTENPFIFISGPNIIPESNKIQFKAIFPRGSVVSNATWVRQGTKCKKEEYTITQSGNCQTVEFSNAIEGEYVVSLNTTESNTIHVFLYGMFHTVIEFFQFKIF